MLKINKKVEYALMALKHLASRPDQSSTVREICDLYGCPFDTTSKVLQALGASNIVKSSQGIKGGYTLIVELDGLNYLQIEKIIEGKTSTVACLSEKKCELASKCIIISPIQKLERQVHDFLQDLKLSDLLLSDGLEDKMKGRRI